MDTSDNGVIYMNTTFELKKAYTNPTFTKYWIEQILDHDAQKVCPYGMECVKRNYPETYALWCDYVAMWQKELVAYIIPVRRTPRYIRVLHSTRLCTVKYRIRVDCEGVEFISIDNVCISADQRCDDVPESIIETYGHNAKLRGKQLRYICMFQQLEEYGYASLNMPDGMKMISGVAELQKVMNWDAIKPR